MKLRTILALFAIVSLNCLAQLPTYRVRFLPPPPGAIDDANTLVQGMGLNNKGQVVGYSRRLGCPFGFCEFRMILWTDGLPQVLPLPSLQPGWNWAGATVYLNNNGDVAATLTSVNSQGTAETFSTLWRGGSLSVYSLPVQTPPITNSGIRGLTDSGQALVSFSGTGPTGPEAFRYLWNGTSQTRILDQPYTCGPNQPSTLYAFSVARNGTFTSASCASYVLFTLGGGALYSLTQAFSLPILNDKNEAIVGPRYYQSNGSFQTLPFFTLSSINNNSVIVGSLTNQTATSQALWANGQVTNVIDLVAASDRSRFRVANGLAYINDSNQILYFTGVERDGPTPFDPVQRPMILDPNRLDINVLPTGAGTVSANPPSLNGSYAGGTSVQLTASAAEPYLFGAFTGAITGPGNPQNLIIQGSQRVTGNFVPKAYTFRRYAGTGVYGDSGDGGPAVNARISRSRSLALDPQGNLYFTDSDNQSLRRVDKVSGNITTIAHFGEFISGVLYEAEGTLLVGTESRIVRVNPANGSQTAIAGQQNLPAFSPDGTIAVSGSVFSVRDLAVDPAGNVYFAEFSTNRVRRIARQTGVLSTVAGTGQLASGGDGGPAAQAQLRNPYGLAFDPKGDLYVSELNGGRVRKIDMATGIISTYAGTGSSTGPGGDGVVATEAAIQTPGGLAFDGIGNLYISVRGSRVVRVDAQSQTLSTIAYAIVSDFFSDADGSSALAMRMSAPTSVALDPATGQLYIGTDSTSFPVIMRLDPSPYPAPSTLLLAANIPVPQNVTVDGQAVAVGTSVLKTPGIPVRVSSTNPVIPQSADREWRFQGWFFSPLAAASPVPVILIATSSAASFIPGAAANVAAASYSSFNRLSINPPANGTIELPGTPPADRFFQGGTTVPVVAVPSPGYVLAGWTGDLSGVNNPTTILMNTPKQIGAVFQPSNATPISAVVTSKTGSADQRSWTVQITNLGTLAMSNASLVAASLTLVSGQCTSPPPLTTALPAALAPAALAPSGGQGTVTLNFNFSSCTPSSRFTLSLTVGAAELSGSATVQNQFR